MKRLRLELGKRLRLERGKRLRLERGEASKILKYVHNETQCPASVTHVKTVFVCCMRVLTRDGRVESCRVVSGRPGFRRRLRVFVVVSDDAYNDARCTLTNHWHQLHTTMQSLKTVK